MQTIAQAQVSTGRSLEELRERLLLLEEERGRMVARDDARLARVIDALDQEYSELYDAIEQLLSGRSGAAVPPMHSDDPSVTADWPPHRPVSRWLVPSITTCAVALGLVMLISSRGQASPATETHIPAPVIIPAAPVPEDPLSADPAVSVQATPTPIPSVSKANPLGAKQSPTRTGKQRKKIKRRSIALHASRDPLANL